MKVILWALAALLVLCRLFTGIIWYNDEATASYIVKHKPNLFVAREITSGGAEDHFWTIYNDEGELPLEEPYRSIMDQAFVLAALSIGLAILVDLRCVKR